MTQVLVTADYLRPGDEVHELLTDHGHEPVYRPFRGPRTPQELTDMFRGVGAAIIASEPVTGRTMDVVPGLRVIVRSGVGYDSVEQ